jgi:hypothetical protein
LHLLDGLLSDWRWRWRGASVRRFPQLESFEESQHLGGERLVFDISDDRKFIGANDGEQEKQRE